MKVALYARVSLDEKDEDKERFQDPENQLQPLRDYCKAMGYVVVEEFVDRGSGANPARQRFRDLMQAAMLRRFEGVLVWKMDRFSREGINEVLGYVKKLKSRGVWIRSLTESWLDTSNEGVAELLLAIMSWVAAEERRKISERTKAGIQRLKNIGQWRGGRPRKEKGG